MAPPPDQKSFTTVNNPPEAAALLEFAQEQLNAQVLDLKTFVTEADGSGSMAILGQAIVLPKGRTITSLKALVDEFRTRPERAIGFARLGTVGSFCDHIVRHRKAGTSVVFAGADAAQLVALYDYHAERTTGREGLPGECGHGALYTCPKSKQWKVWMDKNEEQMLGGDFAHFIEDNIADLLADTIPSEALNELARVLGGSVGSPADLMNLSRNLSINVNSTVKEARNLSNGTVQVAYTETHDDGTGQAFVVPTLFAVGIPVFEGGKRYQLPFRLRYRVAAGRVVWWFALHQEQEALDVAFAEICDQVEAVGIQVFQGTPDHMIDLPGDDGDDD